MNLTAADIDRIVVEVVRRLRAMTAGSSSPVAASELTLSERVITLGTIKGRLDGVRKVIVSDRAVVTPAVKDELRQQKIAWERATTKARS